MRCAVIVHLTGSNRPYQTEKPGHYGPGFPNKTNQIVRKRTTPMLGDSEWHSRGHPKSGPWTGCSIHLSSTSMPLDAGLNDPEFGGIFLFYF